MSGCDRPPSPGVAPSQPELKQRIPAQPDKPPEVHPTVEPAKAVLDFPKEAFRISWDKALLSDNILEKAQLVDRLIKEFAGKFPMEIANIVEELPPGEFRSDRIGKLLAYATPDGLCLLATHFSRNLDPYERGVFGRAMVGRRDLTPAQFLKIAKSPGEGELQRNATWQIAARFETPAQLNELSALLREVPPSRMEHAVNYGMSQMLSTKEGVQTVKKLFNNNELDPLIKTVAGRLLTARLFQYSISEARDFVVSIEDPAVRQEACFQFLPDWLKIDSLAASAWVDSLPADKVKGKMMDILADYSEAMGDKEAAIKWQKARNLIPK